MLAAIAFAAPFVLLSAIWAAGYYLVGSDQ